MDPEMNGLGRHARLPAPAKLNLFLHVLGRRDDGRHALQTLFQLLDFGDEIDLVPREDGLIMRATDDVRIPGDEDLCVRAAHLLKRHTGCASGVSIHVKKRIPMGGGLGGGSSDAATCLVGLNALWGLGLDLDELAGLGLRLGADVPVFVRGQTAFAQGVGEQLTPLPQPELWFCVVTPDCHVSTAEVFAAPELTRDTPALKISDLLAHQADLKNDCWPVVARRYAAVRAAFDLLSRHAPARMSGTGASVFAAFGSREEAMRVATTVPEDWSVFVARGINRSPLHEAVKQLTTGV